MKQKKSAGFTLIEMMVTIAVLSIMAGVSIPSFMSMMPGMRLNGASRQVMGDLMAARMKAVKLNQRTKVFFSSDNNHAYTICNDADNDGTVASGEGDNVGRDLQNEYHDVTFGTTPSNGVVFSPRGTATNKTITVTNSEGTKTITISIAGRVMIN